MYVLVPSEHMTCAALKNLSLSNRLFKGHYGHLCQEAVTDSYHTSLLNQGINYD